MLQMFSGEFGTTTVPTSAVHAAITEINFVMGFSDPISTEVSNDELYAIVKSDVFDSLQDGDVFSKETALAVHRVWAVRLPLADGLSWDEIDPPKPELEPKTQIEDVKIIANLDGRVFRNTPKGKRIPKKRDKRTRKKPVPLAEIPDLPYDEEIIGTTFVPTPEEVAVVLKSGKKRKRKIDNLYKPVVRLDGRMSPTRLKLSRADIVAELIGKGVTSVEEIIIRSESLYVRRKGKPDSSRNLRESYIQVRRALNILMCYGCIAISPDWRKVTIILPPIPRDFGYGPEARKKLYTGLEAKK